MKISDSMKDNQINNRPLLIMQSSKKSILCQIVLIEVRTIYRVIILSQVKILILRRHFQLMIKVITLNNSVKIFNQIIKMNKYKINT